MDEAAADAALEAVSDVVNRRKRGKALGKRHVSGDLTGLYRVKFDVDDRKPERFRILYEIPKDGVIRVIAAGERARHGVYRSAAAEPFLARVRAAPLVPLRLSGGRAQAA
jgi:hypothetical protein